MLDLSKGALLFDCDGTITDENFLPDVLSTTLEKIYADHGQPFDDDLFRQVYKDNKGGGLDKYYLGYLNVTEQQSILDDISVDDFYELAIANYIETTDKVSQDNKGGVSSKINADAINIIQWANDEGIPVAIVTNANEGVLNANLKAARIGVIGETEGDVYADIVVHRGHYGENAINRKPSPFPYENAAEQLGVDPRDCIGFEDSANGHLSMQRAKMGLRVHVCKDEPKEPVIFVKDDNHFGPDVIAPNGKLTPDVLLNAIDELNNTGKVVSLFEFQQAANDPKQMDLDFEDPGPDEEEPTGTAPGM